MEGMEMRRIACLLVLLCTGCKTCPSCVTVHADVLIVHPVVAQSHVVVRVDK